MWRMWQLPSVQIVSLYTCVIVFSKTILGGSWNIWEGEAPPPPTSIYSGAVALSMGSARAVGSFSMIVDVIARLESIGEYTLSGVANE